MKIAPFYAEIVIDRFFSWAQEFDESENHSCLQDYITSWLELDDGMRVAGGDYANFLMAVLVIIHAYEEDPSRLDYHPLGEIVRVRRVGRLINLGEETATYFDPHRFQQFVFHHLSGHSGVR